MIIGSCCFCSLSIIFIVILCQFAESGFFSPTAEISAAILWVWTFFVKIFIGIRIIQTAKDERYKEIKKLYGSKSNDNLMIYDEKKMMEKAERYNMEIIDVEQDIEKERINE